MRLIDADALMKEFERRQERQINEYCDCFLNDAQNLSTEWYCVEDIVENAPTVDTVPVVRCKDCENWDTDWKPADAEDGEHFCLVFAHTSMPDDFCSRGERRCDNE